MASRSRTLYVGVTSDLARRVFQHKTHAVVGFTERYKIDRLVYFQETSDVAAAIGRKKQVKSWRRQKKICLIKSMNPTWGDLSADWFDWTKTDSSRPPARGSE